jgi:hypothetical protein
MVHTIKHSNAWKRRGARYGFKGTILMEQAVDAKDILECAKQGCSYTRLG